MYAFLVGAFVGIVIYSAVNNGFGFFTFFPLVFVYIIVKNENHARSINKEMQSRNLQR